MHVVKCSSSTSRKTHHSANHSAVFDSRSAWLVSVQIIIIIIIITLL